MSATIHRDACDRTTLLIAASLDGVSTPDEERELSRHLESCPLCRETFFALTVEELAGVEDPAAPLVLGRGLDALATTGTEIRLDAPDAPDRAGPDARSDAGPDARPPGSGHRPDGSSEKSPPDKPSPDKLSPDKPSPDKPSEDRMFENYVVHTKRRRPRWVTSLLAASLALHAVLVVALIIHGFWVLERLAAPTRDLALSVAPPPPPPPPPPPASKKKIDKKVVKKIRPKDTTQPVEKPPDEPDVEVVIVDTDEGVEGGVEGGMAGGVAGGMVGGVMEGLPGGKIEAPPPPPPPAKPQIVPQQAVKALRLAGEDQISPDDTTKTQIQRDGQTQVVATVKMCLSEQGSVSSLKMLKSSGYPSYDRKIQSKMRTWRYKPFLVNGRAVPVCTSVTFIYRQS